MERQAIKDTLFAKRYCNVEAGLARSTSLSAAHAAPYGQRSAPPNSRGHYKITKNTQVTMPVCPSDWASNDFAPFGPETYRRAANQRKYIRDKFQRNCWFTRKDGAFYITFNVYHVTHKEIEWFKRVFFLDDQPHTFHDVEV